MWFLLQAFSWWVQFSQSECWQFSQTWEKYLWHLKYKNRHAEFQILYPPDAFSRPVQFLLIRRLTCLPGSDRWYFYRSVLSVCSVQVLSWQARWALFTDREFSLKGPFQHPSQSHYTSFLPLRKIMPLYLVYMCSFRWHELRWLLCIVSHYRAPLWSRENMASGAVNS